jgi:hypothetical protein
MTFLEIAVDDIYQLGKSTPKKKQKERFNLILRQSYCPQCGSPPKDLVDAGSYECKTCEKNFDIIDNLKPIPTGGQVVDLLTWEKLYQLSGVQLGTATMASAEDARYDPVFFAERKESSQVINEFIQAVEEKNDRRLFLLLGDAGMGKTWFMGHTAYELFKEGKVVFFISARESLTAFCGLVFQSTLQVTISKLTDFARSEEKTIYFFIDGYDELENNTREQLFSDLFAQFSSQPHCSVILSSRGYGWEECPIRKKMFNLYTNQLFQPDPSIMQSYQLGDLSAEETKEIIAKRELPTETKEVLQEYVKNPLWLRFIDEYYHKNEKLPTRNEFSLIKTFCKRMQIGPIEIKFLGKMVFANLKFEHILTTETSLIVIRLDDLSSMNHLLSTGALHYVLHDDQAFIKFALEPLAMYALTIYWGTEWEEKAKKEENWELPLSKVLDSKIMKQVNDLPEEKIAKLQEFMFEVVKTRLVRYTHLENEVEKLFVCTGFQRDEAQKTIELRKEAFRLEVQRFNELRLEEFMLEEMREGSQRDETQRAIELRKEAFRLEVQRFNELRLEEFMLEEMKEKTFRRKVQRLKESKDEAHRAEDLRLEWLRDEEFKTGSQRAEAFRLEVQRLNKLRLEEFKLKESREEAQRGESQKLKELRDEAHRAEILRLEWLRDEEFKTGSKRTEDFRLEVQRLNELRMNELRAEELRAEELRLEVQRLKELREEIHKDELQRLKAQRQEELRMEVQRLEETHKPDDIRLEGLRGEEFKTGSHMAENFRLKVQRLKELRLDVQRKEGLRLEELRAEELRLEELRLKELRIEIQKLEESQREEALRLEELRLEELRDEAHREEELRAEVQRLKKLRKEVQNLDELRLEELRLEELRLEELRKEDLRLEVQKLRELRAEAHREEELRLEDLRKESLGAEALRLKVQRLKELKKESQRKNKEEIEQPMTDDEDE